MKSKNSIQTVGNWILLTGIALVAAGCGDKGDVRSTHSKPEPKKESPSVLRLYSWAEYFEVETLAEFERRTGIRVEYVTFGETDEMEARLKSEPGAFDVIVADDSVIEQMAELQLIREIDRDQVPNLKNIESKYLNLPFDPGNKFSVPYTWGTTLVAYRKDKISDPGDSWDILWREDLKGRVAMINERFEVLSLPLFLLGYDLNTTDMIHLGQAADMLVEQAEKVGARYGSDEMVRDSLKDASVWAAMCYSGDAAIVAEENENVGFFIPKEGAPLWIDNFAIARESRAQEAAHSLVNFMLEPEIAAANSNFTRYATPNAAAVPFIDAELLADEAINPPAEVIEKCSFFTKLDNAREQAMNNHWFRLSQLLRVKNLLVGKDGEEGAVAEAPQDEE